MDGAEEVLRALVRECPALSDAALRLAELRGRAGDRGEAVRLLAGVAARDPWHADAIAALGAALLDDGREADAAVAARRALRLDPEHALALAVEGGSLAAAGEHARARACWRRVLALEPVGEGARRAREGLLARGAGR